MYTTQNMQVFLTKKEILDLMDALKEWNEVVGAKELTPSEIGLDSKRYSALIEKLKRQNDI
jgi:hypothetical protein